MANPILWLIHTVINLLEIALFVWIIMSLLITFNIINRHHPFVGKVYDALERLFEPMLRPIRRILPDLGGIDISPIILIIGLQFIQYTVNYLSIKGIPGLM